MNLLKSLIGLSVFLLLTSCGDCVQNVRAVVIDEGTRQPIHNAIILQKGRENNLAITDKAGNFELEGISGGIMKCPAMSIIVAKENYDTLEANLDSGEAATIILSPRTKLQ